jgi:hypothetical protein
MRERSNLATTPVQHVAAMRRRDPDLWAFSTDLDLRTALALARALTRTVAELSPVAEHTLFKAIAAEIKTLEEQGDGDPVAQTVAMALKQYLPGY